jgi:pyruvate, water dikinase
VARCAISYRADKGFDHFKIALSIGVQRMVRSDLVTSGVDRDSEIVAHLFDERNEAVKTMVATVIKAAKAKGRKIGIFGQAPSDYPEFAKFLVEQGIESLSMNPDTVIRTMMAVLDQEKQRSR